MPYLIDDDAAGSGVRVLLITSRQTGRWVVPKGNPIAGLAAHEAAAQEAWEEAGVRGVPSPIPLGTFRYAKRRRGGAIEARVRLFPLAVVEQHDDWPERGQRRLQWLPVAEAAHAVDEPALKALIAGFQAPSPAMPLARQVLPAVMAKPRRRLAVRRWLRSLIGRWPQA